jgi:hypothetical protein
MTFPTSLQAWRPGIPFTLKLAFAFVHEHRLELQVSGQAEKTISLRQILARLFLPKLFAIPSQVYSLPLETNLSSESLQGSEEASKKNGFNCL